MPTICAKGLRKSQENSSHVLRPDVPTYAVRCDAPDYADAALPRMLNPSGQIGRVGPSLTYERASGSVGKHVSIARNYRCVFLFDCVSHASEA